MFNNNSGKELSPHALPEYPEKYLIDTLSESQTSEETIATTMSTSNCQKEIEEPELCMNFSHVLIALVLVILIFLTVFGNILIVLSVILYKRMRTFTNLLLVSLATADLLVGILVTPIALVDLLHAHNWLFGRLLCKIWTTVDVLLCTASILNLCVISLDRYFAITSPLKYTRTRSTKLAAGLLAGVWLTSMVICSPPWFVSAWKHFENLPLNTTAPIACEYTTSLSYRIYSAMGSFYIPLLVMLFVYYKIFRVASSREELLNQGHRSVNSRASGHMRIWRRNHASKGYCRTLNNLPSNMTTSVPRLRMHVGDRNFPRQCTADSFGTVSLGNLPETIHEPTSDIVASPSPANCRKYVQSAATIHEFESIEVDPPTLSDTPGPSRTSHPAGKNAEKGKTNLRKSEENDVPLLSAQAQKWYARTLPNFLMRQAGVYYANAKQIRGSRERMVYLKERKALKTIGLVVSGFIVCWLPFFVLYLLQAALPEQQQNSKILFAIADIFLWLGYSNSVLNPIIYTFYNRDFRRCFRDLVGCGCLQREVNRRLSVKRLHQQQTQL